MAKIEVPIMLDGIELTIHLIKNFVDTYEFEDDTPDDYKNGVYDFARALVGTLEGMKESGDGAK